MRAFKPFLLLFVLLATTQAGHAQSAYDYPWCAQYSGRDSSGALSCYYRSWGECMATMSGIGGSCVRSPYFGHGPSQQPVRRPYRNY